MGSPLSRARELSLGDDPGSLIRAGLEEALAIAEPHEIAEVLSAAACYFFAAGGTSQAAGLLDAVAQGPPLLTCPSEPVKAAKVLAELLNREPVAWLQEIKDRRRR